MTAIVVMYSKHTFVHQPMYFYIVRNTGWPEETKITKYKNLHFFYATKTIFPFNI